MRKKMFSLMMVLFLLNVLVFPVSANSPHMVDQAGLLSHSEAADLESKLTEISNRHGMDIVIVTVESTQGHSPMAYADDYYDYNGYRADGILLLISMEESDWWVSTTGYGITAITDAGLEYIADHFVPYLSDEDFAEGFAEFAEQCDAFIVQAESGDPYDIHNLPKAPFEVGASLLISLIFGLVAALIVTGIMKGQLKTVRQNARADDYMTAGSFNVTKSRDLYLYSHTQRREKPKSNSGSSTHVSSSGRSHGGGGGKF